MKSLQILPKHHKRFRSGFPWLYANEIQKSHLTQDIEPGSLVQVYFQEEPLAIGYYNPHSLIVFRALSRTKQTIDTAFLSDRLREAQTLRERFYRRPFYRLIHAEADGLPGLIVDRFNDVFVVQINTLGMEKLKVFIQEALSELFQPTSIIVIQDTKTRLLEKLPLLEPLILGKPITELTVEENETQFTIQLSNTQKTGWFYDHRENRALIAKLALHKTVIDYFCYSGGFSLQAAKGAKKVIGIDRSESALFNAKRSAQLNQCTNTEFVCADVFDDLKSRQDKQEIFDIVILDPPAFVKSKKDLVPGLKGYEKLITQALPLVAPQGLLCVASCSYHVKLNDLRQCLARGLQKQQRSGTLLKTLSAGFDHPNHPLLEESEYLKGFLVQVD